MLLPVQYETPAAFPTLETNHLHIWQLRITEEDNSPHDSQLLATLPADEQQRAGCFKHSGTRQQYIHSRFALRVLLHRYLQSETLPAMQKGTHGKPFLQGSPLAFNLSHSNGLILLAFAVVEHLGIDCEAHTATFMNTDVRQRVFNRSECDQIEAAADPQQAFFSLWTVKESLLKADGRGLSLDPRSFQVNPVPSALHNIQLPGNPRPFSVCSLPAPVGYSSAVACSSHATHIKLFQATPSSLHHFNIGESA